MARVLIADDSSQLRLLVRRALLLADHDVLEAVDGEQALAILRLEQPDVAILDVIMPGLNGLDVCRAARADPVLETIGIIILSANASIDQASTAGADRFVSKPFLPSDLLAAVNQLTVLQRARQPASGQAAELS